MSSGFYTAHDDAKGDIIIVSTRGPDPDPNNISGGMAPNVLAACQGRYDNVVWFALEKGLRDNFTQAAIFEEPNGNRTSTKQFDVAGIHARIVAATAPEWEGHYQRKTNQFVWPICHNRPDLAIELRDTDHEANRLLNTRLAHDIAQYVQDNPETPIWIHDYHHFMLPKILKDMGVENPVFLTNHIPLPDEETMEQLSLQQRRDMEEYVGYLAHADGVAFQSDVNVERYFDLLGLRNPPNAPGIHEKVAINAKGHRQYVGNFPISINYPDIETKRQATELHSDPARELAKDMVAENIFINFERADYSKGALERAKAFQKMMEDNPDMHGKAQLVLGLEASRTDIPAYRDYVRQVHEVVAGINADPRLQIDGKPPVLECPKIPHSDLIQLLRQDDPDQRKIGTITASADGMNLVCKEFIAAQNPECAGPLIMSDEIGAAQEPGFAEHALTYTPDRGNVQELAEAMVGAINMKQDEANRRCAAAQDYLRSHSLEQWAAAHRTMAEDIQSYNQALENGRIISWSFGES